ncbi:hypothetical protein GF325_16150 [Candidatus Bathyarchaeota archaeon]|nr:hypothetical protein [Candidatus Bathyarchaeota archaeon]
MAHRIPALQWRVAESGGNACASQIVNKIRSGGDFPFQMQGYHRSTAGPRVNGTPRLPWEAIDTSGYPVNSPEWFDASSWKSWTIRETSWTAERKPRSNCERTMNLIDLACNAVARAGGKARVRHLHPRLWAAGADACEGLGGIFRCLY